MRILNPDVILEDGTYDVFANTTADFTLRGYSGSTAEAYAATNGHTFIAITSEMNVPDFVFPDTLTSIESEAFSNSNASVVWIPDTVTFLGNKAFADCVSLSQIRIPSSVTAIPSDVFDGINKNQFIIFGTPGSAAEAFADSEGILFEAE